MAIRRRWLGRGLRLGRSGYQLTVFRGLSLCVIEPGIVTLSNVRVLSIKVWRRICTDVMDARKYRTLCMYLIAETIVLQKPYNCSNNHFMHVRKEGNKIHRNQATRFLVKREQTTSTPRKNRFLSGHYFLLEIRILIVVRYNLLICIEQGKQFHRKQSARFTVKSTQNPLKPHKSRVLSGQHFVYIIRKSVLCSL